jgi:hypothetical protein
MKPTGSSPDRLISLTTGMYNGIHMKNEMENCGAPFKMLEAWRVLRSSPKLTDGLMRMKCAVSEDGEFPESKAWNIEIIDGNSGSTDRAREN